MKKFFLILVFVVAGWHSSNAQQQAMYTQYMFNGLAINPAFAGSHEALSLTALARAQWLGVEGAPRTQTLAIHSPLTNRKFAVGVNFMHDQIAVNNNYNLQGAFAYRFPIREQVILSLGIQTGLQQYSANYDEISLTDPTFSGETFNSLNYTIGAGLYVYAPRWYFSASAPRLNRSRMSRAGSNLETLLVRHYFVSGGYVLDLTPNVSLKPNVLFKMVEGAPLEVDLNANVLFLKNYWAGISWRSMESVDFLFQIQVTSQLQVGYAYDLPTSEALRQVTTGSHELMLNYKINLSKTRIVSPRYF